MESMKQQNVEELKKVVPIWPETKVVTTGMGIENPEIPYNNYIVRTIMTLVRVELVDYMLYEVRHDVALKMDDSMESVWLESLPEFHKKVQKAILWPDINKGIIDNNQKPVNYFPF